MSYQSCDEHAECLVVYDGGSTYRGHTNCPICKLAAEWMEAKEEADGEVERLAEHITDLQDEVAKLRAAAKEE